MVAPGIVFSTPLDFEGLPYTSLVSGGDILPDPASVLTDNFAAQGVVFGRAGISAGVAVIRSDSLAPSSGLTSVAGLNAAGILPGSPAGGALVGDIYFHFVAPGSSTPAAVDWVSFTTGDIGSDIDVFQIRTYDISGTLINSADVSGATRFPWSLALPGIHRVEVDFTGDFGYSLDDLDFGSVAVPAPGAILLGTLGAGLVGCLRRRRAL
jgi:hypothetical protein